LKRFQFRLEKLLGLALSREKAAEADLAQARRVEDEERRRLLGIEATLVRHLAAARDLERRPADVAEIKRHRDYLKKLGADRDAQRRVVTAAEAVTAEKLTALLAIRKERKSLENLKARRQAEYVRQALADEQKALDEVGGRRAAGRRTPA